MFTFLNELQIRNIAVVVVLPVVGMWLSLSTPLTLNTQIWTLVYYVVTGLGITAGLLVQFIIRTTSSCCVQDTIDYGLTSPTMPRWVFRCTLPLPGQHASKDQLETGAGTVCFFTHNKVSFSSISTLGPRAGLRAEILKQTEPIRLLSCLSSVITS